jgi:hypothetical protein
MKLAKNLAVVGLTKLRSDMLQRPSLHFPFNHILIVISASTLSHNFIKEVYVCMSLKICHWQGNSGKILLDVLPFLH